MVTVIECGCAECGRGDDNIPLIIAETYDSVEEAKAAYEPQGWLNGGGRWPIKWEPHPQGGEHVVVGQGSVWILPEVIKELETDG